MLISVSEAAAILGLKSRGSVYRKLDKGELPSVQGADGKPMIEREGLEDLWDRITRRQGNSPELPPAGTERRRRPRPALVAEEVPDFNEERALHEREKRRLAELKRQEQEGELLRREDVREAWTRAVNVTRIKLLSVPSSAKQRIPHLEVGEVETLTELIRDALEELASGEVGG